MDIHVKKVITRDIKYIVLMHLVSIGHGFMRVDNKDMFGEKEAQLD